MSFETHAIVDSTDRAGDWLPVVLRTIVALILTPAAVLKFVDHGNEAAFFAELGIPAPELTVVVVGAIQLVAAVAIVVGFAGRVGALVVIPIMLSAIVLAGVTVTAVAVLLASVGIVVVGTGRYSVWTLDRRSGK